MGPTIGELLIQVQRTCPFQSEGCLVQVTSWPGDGSLELKKQGAGGEGDLRGGEG